MKSDIEIAQSVNPNDICDVARAVNINSDSLEQYGKYKAKISGAFLNNMEKKPKGKLILVTAITPTPAGEGKTTTSVGLNDALRRLNKNSVLALREPSLGPVFGIKGGAAGGGHAQVIPMEDINLHFTGDFHAIGAANNLLAAMLDNHIQQGNELGINSKSITLKRVVDINDRQLRHIVDGLGGEFQGVPREDGFDITVASEVMAILCLSKDIQDLKERLSRIIVGYTYGKKPITAGDLKAQGAMAVLLKEAIKPNLVQSLEKNPVFIHGGPFANIAHGCNSIIATNLSMQLSDYTVTEAGFAADLGAEKFFDIKCRLSGITPSCVVLVATIRALKYHGGVDKSKLDIENVEALRNGLPNLFRHVSNIRDVFGLPCVVAVNAFPKDTEKEITVLKDECKARDIKVALSEVWAFGGEGGLELAREVINLCDVPNEFKFAYKLEDSIKDKLNSICTKIYRADKVIISDKAESKIKEIENLGYDNLPICMAKTQYSFSDNPKLIGAPKSFDITVKDIRLAAGAGFIVAYTGDIMTMPGLPKVPAAESIDIKGDGTITGLF